MTGASLTATARCLHRPPCDDWHPTGPVEQVDLEARRHSGEKLTGRRNPGHPTMVSATPTGR